LTKQLPKLLKFDAQERVGAQLKQFDGVSKHDESIAILMTDNDVLKHTTNPPESKEENASRGLALLVTPRLFKATHSSSRIKRMIAPWKC
jgi:hypothetical protein